MKEYKLVKFLSTSTKKSLTMLVFFAYLMLIYFIFGNQLGLPGGSLFQCLSFKSLMVYKLCLIPFYIINFLYSIFLVIFLFVFFPVGLALPFVAAYTYLTMVGTSVHVIAKLFTLWRNKIIPTKQFIVHPNLRITTVAIFR